jgi:hypothetical protein
MFDEAGEYDDYDEWSYNYSRDGPASRSLQNVVTSNLHLLPVAVVGLLHAHKQALARLN